MVSKLTTISFIFMILFSTPAFSYKTIESKNGQEILSRLQDGSSEIYVLLFYVSGQKGGVHNAKTTEDERELIGRILNRYPTFNYAKINADDQNYDDLIRAWGIIKTELHESPSVLIMQGGVGVWIHGPQTMNKLDEFARE